jgi:cyclopropane fatty-acyl-phospholipid synthase-like methyltransferase
MALRWKLMYRIGFTPWEDIGEPAGEQIDRLLSRENPPAGKALDIGCGRGAHSVRLARLGWEVTGIDIVPHAVKQARARAASAGVDARFVVGDVTRMSAVAGRGYRFLFDAGCFHLLGDAQKAAYAREATSASDPDAVLLLFAFTSGTKRPLPQGLSRAQIETIFGGWQLTDVEEALLPPRLATATAHWYRLSPRR